ncbi:MAG: UDP-3-O-(3-hydroxymyristoyl)glucosamine N-acyltransferase [Acidobacteriota bacterium]
MGGTLEGDEARRVSDVARLDEAGPEHLSFCALAEYRSHVSDTAASAVIVGRDFDAPSDMRPDLTLIRVDNPYLAVAVAVRHFHPEPEMERVVHPSAVLESGVALGQGVGVGAGAVIGAGSRIGNSTLVGPGCVLAAGTVIGDDCTLQANVSVYPSVRIGDRVIVHAGAVLGADGFGYAPRDGKQVKIPQVGGVLIEDDVEIGANACIDRASLGVTRIGRGAKIDNLVQIGHNCDIGEDTVLSGQVGLGGSTVLGKGVLVGGQVGFRGHLRVGDGARIAAGSGITNSLPAGITVSGNPYMEVSRWRRAMAAVRNLPDLVRRIRRLEAALADSKKEDE